MFLSRIEWLQEKVFPEAMQARSFGAEVKKFVSFEPNNQKGVDQFMSDVVFGDVTIEKENGQLVTESVVIKLHATHDAAIRIANSDAMFHNEVLFYSELIPLFQNYDNDDVLSTCFSEFVYGKATNGLNPEEDVIILKNINKKGFKLTDEKLFIDEKHIKLALDKIAKFHALSFKCQSSDPVGFQSIVSKIKNPQIKLDDDIYAKHILTRGINPLKNDPMYKDRLSSIYKYSEEAGITFEKYWESVGPLNAIVHGDFNRKNMMFRYGSNGEPLDVIFFDMATIVYSSPAIDTTCLLFFNASPEVRRLHWDDFLKTYYDSLSKQLDGHSAKPMFEDVELDLRRKGIHVYHLTAFAMPFMVEGKTKEDWEDNYDTNNPLQKLKVRGGPKATEYLADIVKHMLEKDYIFEN